MNYTSLLQRQLKRYFLSESDIPQELHGFLDAVSRSYGHYERDHLLGKRSLELSSAELQQLMEDQSEQKARLRAVLQSASDGIVVVDAKNEIILCNPVAAKDLGFASDDELLGKNTASIQISLLDQMIRETTLYTLFCQKNLKKFYEISIRNSTSIFELSFSKFEHTNQEYQICILRDISQRKLSEKKIAVRHEVTRLLSISRSIDVAAPKIIANLCDELNWDLAIFWLEDLKHDQLVPLFYYDSKKTSSSSTFVRESLSVSFAKKENNLPFILQNVESQTFSDGSYSRMEEASQHGFKGCFIIPFVFEEDVMGFIELFTPKIIVEDLEIKKIFHDIGSEIALYIMQQYTEERVASLTRELLSSAKNLGMSQIANSTLHNVGNALNALTTAASLLEENQDASELKNLPRIASLIKEHKDDLSNYISNDPKGKLLPDYILSLSEWWQKDQEAFQGQLKQFFTSIQHIQKIIRTQQAIDKFGGLKEKISINQLLDDLLGLLSKEIKNFGITVEKKYQDLPNITVEKSSLVQILENLFVNAIDALCATKENRHLTIFTRLIGSNMIQIEVTDNGIGITSAQLEKMFSYGFTLKEAGHGYGLHNSLKLAKELGGDLIAKSEGLKTGASFFFSIPVN